MKLSPKNRQFVMIGGWLGTAAFAFAFGRMTKWLDAPSDPAPLAKSSSSGSGPNSLGVNQQGHFGSGLGRVGSATSADGSNGAVLTVGQVTNGQPLEDWLKKLLAQEDDIYRMQNFLRLIEALNTPEDIKAALKIVGTARGGGGGRGGFGGRFTEYGMLMEKLTQLDPKGAVAFAAEQEGGEKFMAAASAVRTWTRMDPAAALAWAQTEGAKLQMDGGRGGPGGGGPPRDGQEEGPRENFALMGVLTQMAKTDLDKAFATASTGTDELGRMSGRMVETLAAEMITQKGADAAKKAAEGLPEGDFRNEYIQQLTGRLADKDAPGTAEWANSLPAGDAKRRALGQAIGEWAENDATAAGNFLKNLPPSPETDSARERYAGEVARKDPNAALTWAKTITDPERQDRTVINLASDWMRREPEPAKQWLATAQLTEEQKVQITARATPRGGGPGGAAFRGPGGTTGGNFQGRQGGGGRGR